MGYTHYWTIREGRDQADYGHALDQAIRIALASPVKLLAEFNQPGSKPKLGDGIRFNGAGDDGHETFWIPPHTVAPELPYSGAAARLRGSNFCKTAHKPYDVVVVAILATLEHLAPDHITSTSDGWATEWLEGIRLAREVTGEAIEMPAGVLGVDHTNAAYQAEKRADDAEAVAALASMLRAAVLDR